MKSGMMWMSVLHFLFLLHDELSGERDMKDEEEIRYERFFEDGDGLIIVYPDNAENDDGEENCPINKEEVETGIHTSSLS